MSVFFIHSKKSLSGDKNWSEYLFGRMKYVCFICRMQYLVWSWIIAPGKYCINLTNIILKNLRYLSLLLMAMITSDIIQPGPARSRIRMARESSVSIDVIQLFMTRNSKFSFISLPNLNFDHKDFRYWSKFPTKWTMTS